MSWKDGSHVTEHESSPSFTLPWMWATLASRLPWLTITPLGDEVEPEVY